MLRCEIFSESATSASARLAIYYPALVMKAIALLTLLALSSSAEARVGETLDECS